jgi:hypothetical protein
MSKTAPPQSRPLFPPGHFYSPEVDWAEVQKRRAQIFDPEREVPGIDFRLEEQVRLVESFAAFYEEQPFPCEAQDPPQAYPHTRYHFENPAYSYTDAIFLYCMLRHLRPKRLIEIGSGYSSCVTLDTNELFLEGRLRSTFVDPYPELLRSLLRPEDAQKIEIVPSQVQDLPLQRFQELEANDVLLIDSTHVSKTGSDVNHLVCEVLPRLKPGVHVHFHDIFYPFEYPESWLEEGRSWNEAYLLKAFLQFNPTFEIVLMSSLMHLRHPELMRRFPLTLRNHGGNLWIRRLPIDVAL